METTKTIAKVNDVSIVMIDNSSKLVPLKPICDALGISWPSQYAKIQNDEFLNSVVVLSETTGHDKKEYLMACIPFMYVFGWLFTINPKNVAPEAQEAVSKYRLECYKVLFKHFTDQSEFLQQKQTAVEKQVEEVDRIRTEFKNTKIRLADAQSLLHQIMDQTFDIWKMNNSQLKLDFPVIAKATSDDD